MGPLGRIAHMALLTPGGAHLCVIVWVLADTATAAGLRLRSVTSVPFDAHGVFQESRVHDLDKISSRSSAQPHLTLNVMTSNIWKTGHLDGGNAIDADYDSTASPQHFANRRESLKDF